MRITLIQAHPDPAPERLCRALAAAYEAGAREAGHDVRRIDLAPLDIPLLRSAYEWQHGEVPASLKPAQADIAWAEHLVFFFPLWLGDMPALMKAFLEQVARRGFAFEPEAGNPLGRKLLTGRSARVVVTMGMPALVYRWVFRAHSVKSLERNILGFVGIGPIRETLVGAVDQLGASGVAQWLTKLRRMGREGL